MRLHGRRAFQGVFDAGVRKRAGPLTVFTLPNALGRARIGLSVSRRVGGAVLRHRIKRRLREAFRLSQHDLPGAYDMVIVVYRHDVLPLGDYQQLLWQAVHALDKTWQRKAK